MNSRLFVLIGRGWACACALLLCCGCGSKLKLYPVRGQVFADSAPATGAMVVFHPVDADQATVMQPSGEVDKDGVFTLRTYIGTEKVSRDGAPAGDYRITVMWFPENFDRFKAASVIPDRLKGRYSNAQTSKLSAQVNAAPTEVPAIHLKMKQ